MNTERYYYEPTPKDVANFEAIWAAMWHTLFVDLVLSEYTILKNFTFEVFLVGINQNKHDLKLDLEKSLSI